MINIKIEIIYKTLVNYAITVYYNFQVIVALSVLVGIASANTILVADTLDAVPVIDHIGSHIIDTPIISTGVLPVGLHGIHGGNIISLLKKK